MMTRTVCLMRPAVLLLLATLLTTGTASLVQAQLVPGTGQKVDKVGDDFEDVDWGYIFNGYKSSQNIDDRVRSPMGRSKNGRWGEGKKRGHPDVIKRVSTPEGGLEGSRGSLLLRSLYTGVPRRLSHVLQQDDLIVQVASRMRGHVPIRWSPNIVVRVYLPPFDEWEDRTGNSFAFRGELQGEKRGQRGGLFGLGGVETDTYWPGLFIFFQSKTDRKYKEDSAHFLIRGGPTGHDFRGPDIPQTGWWTLGMSYTADGQVHYYARPGIGDLRAEDHISSQFPYGFRAQRFESFFFNVVNGDNGRSWSTNWIIDDPTMYILTKERTVGRPSRRRK